MLEARSGARFGGEEAAAGNLFGRKFGRCRSTQAKGGLLGLKASGKAARHCAFQRQAPVHDVSSQMTAAEAGRYRGSVPRSKNSMTVMRPPQQGQGGKAVSAGSSLLGLAAFSADGIAPSSSRSRAKLAARVAEANSP